MATTRSELQQIATIDVVKFLYSWHYYCNSSYIQIATANAIPWGVITELAIFNSLWSDFCYFALAIKNAHTATAVFHGMIRVV